MLQNKGFIPVQCSQLVTATAKSRGYKMEKRISLLIINRSNGCIILKSIDLRSIVLNRLPTPVWMPQKANLLLQAWTAWIFLEIHRSLCSRVVPCWPIGDNDQRRMKLSYSDQLLQSQINQYHSHRAWTQPLETKLLSRSIQLICELRSSPSDLLKLIEKTVLSQSHISRQLSQLSQADLVRSERQGQRVIVHADDSLVDNLCSLVSQRLCQTLEDKLETFKTWGRLSGLMPELNTIEPSCTKNQGQLGVRHFRPVTATVDKEAAAARNPSADQHV